MLGEKDDDFMEADKDAVWKVFLSTAIKSFVYTILWIPIFLARCILVVFVENYKPSYGKILDACDSTLDEDYSNNNPKNNLVFTLVLEGPLELQKLRQLFRDNVLKAKISDKKTRKDKLRYPEFTQFQADFAGYKFWKNDDLFNIDNHIIEQPYSKKFQSISKIHQGYITKRFDKRRSPWEMNLVKGFQNNAEKTLLIYRCHHTLGDTKSQLKVFVECLGQKSLRMPNVQYSGTSLWDTIHYYAWMPFYFVYIQVLGHFTSLKADKCLWKVKADEKEPKMNLAISNPISMNEIKAIAKKHNVTASAVIMAAVAGGIAKSDKRLAKSGIPTQWILPKINHPDTLANHNYSAIMNLPTDISSPLERLQKCNEIFLKMKSSNLHKYGKSVVFQLGTWFNPFRANFLKKDTFPLMVTNIAGEGEGFQIGSSPCSKFSMTPVPPPGACGAIICGFSYQNVIELSTTAKDAILTEAQTYRVTEMMEKEFEVLRKATK